MSRFNLDEAGVEIRELRIGSITGYSGQAGDLVAQSRDGHLAEHDRRFSQCMSCSSGMALIQLGLVRDAAIINHAPVGCAGDFFPWNFVYQTGLKERHLETANVRYFTTNLEERDTVFGAAQKLEETIRAVYKRVKPKAIFITTSCASGIVGDDVDGVANTLSEELGIPVVSCLCEGFRSRLWTTGFDSAYHSIVRKIVKPPEKKTNKINIIQFYGSHLFDEFFKSLGYEAHYIVPFTTVDELSHISEATASIQICHTLSSYFGAALEDVYGVPELKAPAPFGIAATDIWMRELGKLLNREEEIEQFIAGEHERVLPKLEKYREFFKGKTGYVTAGAAFGHGVIALARDIGFKLVGSSIFHHDPIFDNRNPASDALAHAVHTYGDIPNYRVCNKQTFELYNSLNRLRPDILLARHPGMTLWGAKLGIPSILLCDEQFGLGYQGVLNFASRIQATITNHEFIDNLSKHRMTPYTKWWLEQEPDYYLEQQ